MKLKYLQYFEKFNVEKKITSTYEVWTEEDVEFGESSDKGYLDEEGESMLPDDEDTEMDITAVDKAVNFLKKKYAIHASTYPFTIGVSYSTESETNIRTGEQTIITYHLSGFTPAEELEIYNKLKGIIKESKTIGINKKYTHFAVLKTTNKIVNGWEYKGYEQEELNGNKEHYFWSDLRDLDLNPKDVKILTAKYLLNNDINPYDSKNWRKYDEVSESINPSNKLDFRFKTLKTETKEFEITRQSKTCIFVKPEDYYKEIAIPISKLLTDDCNVYTIKFDDVWSLTPTQLDALGFLNIRKRIDDKINNNIQKSQDKKKFSLDM